MPVNYAQYQQGLQDPLQTSLESYKQGVAIREGQTKRADLELKKQQALTLQTDLATLASNTQAGAKDYASMMTKYPQLSEHFQKAYSVLESGQQEVQRNHALQLFSALDANQTDVAVRLLTEQKLAAENSGLTQEATAADLMLKIIETNPEAAKASAGLMLSATMGPDKFAATYEKIQTEQRKRQLQPGEIDKQAADLSLTKADTKKALLGAEKLGAEVQKAALELKALEAGGAIVEPEKRFDMEIKLKDRYAKQTSDYRAGRVNLDTIKSSAADKTGAGDIALVTSFMKMLDPGSTVRESEFATARDTAGLYAMLQNWAQKKTTGAFLNPKQRTSFANLAEKYMKAAEREETRVRKDMGTIIKNYKLEPENVFGTRTDVAAPGKSTTKTAPQRGYMRHAGAVP